MAPLARAEHDHLEQQLKDIIQDLYQVMVQTSTFNATDRPSQPILASQLRTLSSSLQALHRSASSPDPPLPWVPPELLEYVEAGRNPDIYTREFVELVRRRNQVLRGKSDAFGQFRDVLAADVLAAMPELRDDVRVVVEGTGGHMPGSSNSNGGGANAGEEEATPTALGGAGEQAKGGAGDATGAAVAS
ncbi:hypothetical protein N3K66_001871 [Trichothecium roseum]|uniref:Uncharacterized protein n=1 Tax=Trichothecium roseum TaxID=47278 RepID=A0ACC0V8I2_9HYPO|nr:hypothetical protein N3K66_001871 [Trichothecium roseum]